MYCGSNKIALASKKQISDALFRLLEEKSFENISISQLCREAKISRQTFYSLYASKENIIIELLQASGYVAGDENADQKNDEFNFKQFCIRFSTYLIENQNMLKILEKNNLVYLLYDSYYEAIVGCDYFMSDLSRKDKQYIASFIASGYMGITKIFVQSGCQDDQQYLEDKIFNLFKGSYIF